MSSCIIDVPIVNNMLAQVSDILVNKGITRRTTIKDNVLQGFGEVGIGTFYITKKTEDTLVLEARNKQSLEIIGNLLKVELEELTTINEEAILIKENVALCNRCDIQLEFLGEKDILEDVTVKFWFCPQCNKIELYKI